MQDVLPACLKKPAACGCPGRRQFQWRASFDLGEPACELTRRVELGQRRRARVRFCQSTSQAFAHIIIEMLRELIDDLGLTLRPEIEA